MHSGAAPQASTSRLPSDQSAFAHDMTTPIAAAHDMQQKDSQAGPTGQPRQRGYRACLGCRSRKLKCDLGDPSAPSLATCRRCTRESRQCVFDLNSDRKHSRRANLPRASTLLPNAGTSVPSSSVPAPLQRHSTSTSHGTNSGMSDYSHGHDEVDQLDDDDATDNGLLLSTALHNPADALRLLASASSAMLDRGNNEAAAPSPPETSATLGWRDWHLIKIGRVNVQETQTLFRFFEERMAPLYTLQVPQVFSSQHLSVLTTSESVLLGAIISIAARFCTSIDEARRMSIHTSCSEWTRFELAQVLDGSSPHRNIAAVEAFLLFAEWPPLVPSTSLPTDEDVTRPIKRYDSLSWSYIGAAVRLAQELGMDEQAEHRYAKPAAPSPSSDWAGERGLRVLLCALNADSHVSIRLGKAAVGRTVMPSAWWTRVLSGVSYNAESGDTWAEPAVPQACIAPLMGTIQDRLYPDKEVTRAIIKSGSWEPFLRSLSHELKFMKQSCRHVLGADDIQSTLLHIEFDYVLLYGNTIALRALQERLRDGTKQPHPALLNLQEGSWLIQAVEAAAAILRRTVDVLQLNDTLSLAPCRIYQRVLFASVFLFKALAVGIVEHGQKGLHTLLASAIEALRLCSADDQHIPRSFAALLGRLRLEAPERSPETATAALAKPPPQPMPFDDMDDQAFSDLLGQSLLQNDLPVTDLPLVPPTSSSTFFVTFPRPQNGGAGGVSSAPPSMFSNRPLGGFSGDVTAEDSVFGTSTPFEWDPYVGSMDAVREQDDLFARLLGTGDLGQTLVGSLGL